MPWALAPIWALAARPLCSVLEAVPGNGGQRTMPALGLNLQNWACNLHQQDLPVRFPPSGLLILTPTWKCQGPKEARTCVICTISSKQGDFHLCCFIRWSPAPSILLCLSQLTLTPACLFFMVSRASGAHLRQYSRGANSLGPGFTWPSPACDPKQETPPLCASVFSSVK